MKKILFLIHNLGPGGAEKVLVNLVNHLDRKQFDITLIALFGGGVNEQFLRSDIRYIPVCKTMFRGNCTLMKIFSPEQLHRMIVKDHYDIEVSYLEGPSARVISGCKDPDTKLVSWIHIEQHNKNSAAQSFRSYEESKRCYERFDQAVCVSETVKQDFQSLYPEIRNVTVRYNTIETDRIFQMKDEPVEDGLFHDDEIKLAFVGKISKRKGIDRLAHIVKQLRVEGYPIHFYALGTGVDQKEIEDYVQQNSLEPFFSFLGYQTNPYKYVSKCDMFVCASLAEGFSTAATEALIVGTPVCTVEVSGMKEMLGEKNEYGIVTENSEEALYEGIKRLLDDLALLAHYKKQAKERGKVFSTEATVKAVEEMLLSL